MGVSKRVPFAKVTQPFSPILWTMMRPERGHGFSMLQTVAAICKHGKLIIIADDDVTQCGGF